MEPRNSISRFEGHMLFFPTPTNCTWLTSNSTRSLAFLVVRSAEAVLGGTNFIPTNTELSQLRSYHKKRPKMFALAVLYMGVSIYGCFRPHSLPPKVQGFAHLRPPPSPSILSRVFLGWQNTCLPRILLCHGYSPHWLMSSLAPWRISRKNK